VAAPDATTTDKQQLVDRVDALTRTLEALPQGEVIQKAIYHCHRLQLALKSSHSEGTRFAAFTVRKIIRDHAAELPATVSGQLEPIITALEASGIDLHK
jgi:hypothetical protein